MLRNRSSFRRSLIQLREVQDTSLSVSACTILHGSSVYSMSSCRCKVSVLESSCSSITQPSPKMRTKNQGLTWVKVLANFGTSMESSHSKKHPWNLYKQLRTSVIKQSCKLKHPESKNPQHCRAPFVHVFPISPPPGGRPYSFNFPPCRSSRHSGCRL